MSRIGNILIRLEAPAIVACSILTIIVGVFALERGELLVSVPFVFIGVAGLGSASSVERERARSAGIMWAVSTLVNGDGTEIHVTHFQGGSQTVVVHPNEDAAP